MIEGTCSLSFFMFGPLRRRYLLSLPLVSSTLSSRAVFAAVKSSRAVSTTARRMASEGGDGEPSKKNLNSHPGVAKMQELLAKDHTGGWDECWKEGKTPWDLGQSTPVILHLLQTGTLPKGRVLIPGCGTGYDVVAIADPERYVVGLDVSDNAVKKANELFALSPNANYFTFLAADFFTWRPTQLFDLVFDYTFFCAIEPQMRLAWASQMRNLLKLDGELITLIFPIDDHAGGPPYAVSLSDYEDVLSPLGFRATYVADNELAIGGRKGREKLARWKRFLTPQL